VSGAASNRGLAAMPNKTLKLTAAAMSVFRATSRF
jgi:hypothetical protein